jgi:hypothetical protein
MTKQIGSTSIINDRQKMLSLADANLVSVIRQRMQAVPEARFSGVNGFFRFNIGRSIFDGHLNGLLSRDSHIAGDQAIATADEFYHSLGHGFIFWIREHADSEIEQALREKGLTPIREPGAAGMAIDHRLDSKPTPPGIVICKVTDQRGVLDFAQVTTDAFSMAPDISKLAVGQTKAMVGANVAAFVAYEGDKPLAAAMVFIEGVVAGLYYVGTVAEARGRGLAGICTRTATNAGFDLGADVVILGASLMAEPIYEYLGYKTLTRYRWYRVEAPFTKR